MWNVYNYWFINVLKNIHISYQIKYIKAILHRTKTRIKVYIYEYNSFISNVYHMYKVSE